MTNQSASSGKGLMRRPSFRKLAVFVSTLAVLPRGYSWVPTNKRILLPNPATRAFSTIESESSGILIENEEVDRRIRFGGVGRLYAAEEDPTLTSSISDDQPSDSVQAILDRLQDATVAVVGLGGVGSWAAEALCRSGVGNLILIDLDDICASNINRQLHALSSSVGNMKIDEMKRRLLDINPDCNITLIHDFISTDNVHEVIGQHNLTALLDAIDGSQEKSALLAACTDLGIPVVTCGGSAGRKDPTQILVNDLTEISGDKLLASCRKNLRKLYGFPKGMSFQEQQKKENKNKKRKWNIECVYSLEEQKRLPQGSDASSLRRCDGALGTACFVTGTSGFVAAARVIDMIAENRLVAPRR